MESIYELIKTHSAGKTEADMWATTKMVSDAIESGMEEKAKEKLYSDLYGYLSGGHYDEHFAHEAVEKMYFTTEDGQKHHGPYFTDSVMKEIYQKVKDHIKGYNEWDFAVALNMIAAENHSVIKKWFPEDDSDARLAKYTEMAVAWLADPKYVGGSKIWRYLHS